LLELQWLSKKSHVFCEVVFHSHQMRRKLLLIITAALSSGVSRRQNFAIQLAMEKLQDLSNSSIDSEIALDNATIAESGNVELADLFLLNSSFNISRSSHGSASKDFDASTLHLANVNRSVGVGAEANETNASASERVTSQLFESSLGNILGNESHPDLAELPYNSFIAVKQKISKISGNFSRVFEDLDSKQLCYGLAGGILLGWCCCCALHSVLEANKADRRDYSDWSPMASKTSAVKRTFVEPAKKMKQKAGDALRMAKPSGMHLHGIHGMHLRSHQSDGDRHSRDDDDSMNRYGSR